MPDRRALWLDADPTTDPRILRTVHFARPTEYAMVRQSDSTCWYFAPEIPFQYANFYPHVAVFGFERSDGARCLYT